MNSLFERTKKFVRDRKEKKCNSEKEVNGKITIHISVQGEEKKQCIKIIFVQVYSNNN